MLPSHVHPPEGDQEHESPNLGVTWHVGRGWPKSGCAGSLVGVGLAGGRGGETPQTGFLASGAACLTSPRPSASSCNNMRSSSGCTMPTREGYTSLPVRLTLYPPLLALFSFTAPLPNQLHVFIILLLINLCTLKSKIINNFSLFHFHCGIS